MRPKFKSMTAALNVFLAAGFILSAVSFGIVPADAQSLSVTLRPGITDSAVSALQKSLIQQGYLSIGAPTGYFGALTRAAVIAYQKANGLPQTGTMTLSATGTAALFASVATPFVPASVGGTGTQIKHIQQFLIERGFLNIATTTGYFGPVTQAAVMAYQKAHGLPQTGIIDQATFAAMNSFGSSTTAASSGAPSVASLAAEIAALEAKLAALQSQSGGQPASAPAVTALSPTSATVGTQVTVTGTNFAASNTVLFDGLLAASNVSSNGTTLIFTVPQSLRPNCAAGVTVAVLNSSRISDWQLIP